MGLMRYALNNSQVKMCKYLLHCILYISSNRLPYAYLIHADVGYIKRF